MSETDNEVKAKAAPETKMVTMEDGREVAFVGKRRMLKKSSYDAESVTTRFDFSNGESRSLTVHLSDPLALRLLGHGVEQKGGDETAGDKTVEDMVLHVESILDRLSKGEWGVERAASDGFSGASVVIRAIVEASGGTRTVAQVKDWLEKKLAAGKETGLTRQKLYAAFRAPDTKTAPIIARLEAEKASKESGVDGNEALGELFGD